MSLTDRETDFATDETNGDDSAIEIARGESTKTIDEAKLFSAFEEETCRFPTRFSDHDVVGEAVADAVFSDATAIFGSKENNGGARNADIDQKAISNDSRQCTPSMPVCKSALSSVGRHFRPVASSTPLVRAGRTNPSINSTFQCDTASLTRILSSSAVSSMDDDPVLYYGAPMPGTSIDRRRRMFRHFCSIEEEEISTPTAERVAPAPTNSFEFIPKLTSTADESDSLHYESPF